MTIVKLNMFLSMIMSEEDYSIEYNSTDLFYEI
jgi:hypothetical protein